MKKLLTLALFALMACSSEKKQQEAAADTTPKAITFIFKSTGTNTLMVGKQITPAESDSLDSNYEVNPGDTITISLQENQQLMDVFYPIDWSNFFVFSNGDSILVEIDDKQKAVYKLAGGKKESFRTAEEEAFGKSARRTQLNERLEKMINAGKNTPADSTAAFVKASNEYYLPVIDSLTKTKDERAHILADVAQIEQYRNLWDLSVATQDAELTRLLKSDKYLNVKNYNDRNLNVLFNFYNHNTITRNRQKKTLVEVYKTEFEEFPAELKANFKLRTITQMIIDKYDRKTVIEYIDDYKANYGTSKTLERWMKEIEYGVAETGDLNMKDAKDHKETFETMIAKHKGKVVYVDFWASWCGPCIAEMPYSDKLKKEQKDVVFVYLALNDEEEPWKTAMDKYNIKENSYFITNSESSSFLGKHKITSIPRYMIIDKKGKISNPDAPRPSSTEIVSLLNKELKR